jgi:tRNA-2-methylthio-N6-dimethylallyladenosine synthase
MARNRGEELFRKMSHIDLICGPAHFDKIPGFVETIRAENIRIIDLEDIRRNDAFYRASYRKEQLHAQVVISTGCSNNCSYCLVPYVRGALRPRNPKDIIDEVKNNVSMGRRRITLLGQNVNDYFYECPDALPGKGVINFADLLKMAAKVPGVADVDFITAHPKNTPFDLLYLMAESDIIVKHLHLPFQSGSNRILKLMNRGYTREDYLTLAQNYKKITKGTLSTDVIVGYPTETEEDFLHTKEMLRILRFKYAYIFKYSPRPRTKAAELSDDVPEEVKVQRHKILLDLQRGISKQVTSNR